MVGCDETLSNPSPVVDVDRSLPLYDPYLGMNHNSVMDTCD